jgi:hypothetical protein
MALSRTTAFVNTTEILVTSAACRVKAIELEMASDAASPVFFQAWNATNPTPGTTAPDIQVRFDILADQGSVKAKIHFSQGLRFDTGLR